MMVLGPFKSFFGLGDVPLNRAATFPITSEIEGSIAPAVIADMVPIYNNILSSEFMYLKNILKGICLGGASTSFNFCD